MAVGVAGGEQEEAPGMAGRLMSLSSPATVRAAGGLLWRPGGGGPAQVLVVHRPKYGDWSLPKGKCEPEETDEDCALREVEEETGYRCRLGPELPGTTYVDRKGRGKSVRYWVMTVDGGAFRPNDEVDEIRWLEVPEARAMLTYRHDADVLASFAGGGAGTGGDGPVPPPSRR